MFDQNLAQYALKNFKRDGISVKTEHHIEELRPGLPGSEDPSNDGGCFTLRTKEDGEFGVGMCMSQFLGALVLKLCKNHADAAISQRPLSSSSRHPFMTCEEVKANPYVDY